ncbi:hypothetical protein FF100_26135 [Methylobacterium terricola]|uniref:Uncharacterized protein n=1 Tax=Methylobacterium terricola TaxID=2583531 RepID=A0A5C4LAN5_9HYPH|nr:hypothetical protein [Methylobacterium terricola]TNC09329.1 hypothetical protein FF100_26135 [Methylobacterium terricola]
MRAIQATTTRIPVTAHVRGHNERREEASLLSEREIKAIQRSRHRTKELARAYSVSTETMSLIRSGKL